MKDDIGSTPEGSDGEYSLDEDDQLQPEDTLDDRGVDDVLDEGYSPPDRQPRSLRGGGVNESLDERLAEEEPDTGAVDPLDEITADERRREDWRSHEADHDDEFEESDEVGDRRAGRLISPDAGSGIDTEPDAIAEDAGIDGAAASAEEAAVHYISEDSGRP